MTFTAIVAKVADRLNLTSAAALTRIGEEVNDRYREVMSGVGLQTSVRTTISQAVTAGNNQVELACQKVFSVFNNYGRSVSSITRSSTTATVTTAQAHGYQTGASVKISGATQTEYNGVFTITVTSTTTFTYTVSGSPATPATGTILVELLQTQWILGERTMDELRMSILQVGDLPQNWAPANMNADEVTIQLDMIPSTAFILNADVEMNITSLSGVQVPGFAQDFHDILVRGAMADELMKMEKYSEAETQEGKFEKRLSELRLYIAKSNGLDIFQGRDQAIGLPSGFNGLAR